MPIALATVRHILVWKIRIMCPSGATRLPADCSFSDTTKRVGLVQSRHHLIEILIVLAII
jgi:hypothetical protein